MTSSKWFASMWQTSRVSSEPGKVQNVNHEPCHGVVAYPKERGRPEQSMALITKGTWIACAWMCWPIASRLYVS